MRNQIVILAGGKGTRMANSNMPKVLVMLKNKPLILHLLEEIEKVNQLAKPVIVTGYMHKKVEAVLGEHYSYAFQEQQLGTAHAVSAAKRKIKAENILVLYGDMPFIKAESIKELIRIHFKSGANISMLTAQVKNFRGIYKNLEHYGRVIRNPITHKIEKSVEYKDATDLQRKIKEVNPCIYMFRTKWLWENLAKIGDKNSQQEYYLTDIIDIAVSQGSKINTLAVPPEEVLGVNSKDDLKVAEKVK